MPPRPPVLPPFPAVAPRPAAKAPRPSLLYWPPVAAAAVVALLLTAGVVAWASTQPSRRALAPAPADATLDEAAPAAPAQPAPAVHVGWHVGQQAAAVTEAVAAAPARAPAAPPAPPPPAAESKPAAAAEEPAAGEKYGTAVTFLASPAEAARRADKGGKLLLVLHVSGNFEEECFT